MDEHKATIEDLAERPKASVEATHVWLPPNSLEVPESIRKKYPNSRFYWRSRVYAEEKGVGRWEYVETDGSVVDASQSDRLGRAEDTRLRRGDLDLVHAPEELMQDRERVHEEKNLQAEQSSIARLTGAMQAESGLEITGEVKVEEEVVSVQIPSESESDAEPKRRGRPPKSEE